MLNAKRSIGFKILVVVEHDETGFHAYCPALKGLHTCGDTEEEALQNATDAAKAYILSLIKHGDPIPVGVVMGERSKPITLARETTRRTESLTVTCAI